MSNAQWISTHCSNSKGNSFDSGPWHTASCCVIWVFSFSQLFCFTTRQQQTEEKKTKQTLILCNGRGAHTTEVYTMNRIISCGVCCCYCYICTAFKYNCWCRESSWPLQIEPEVRHTIPKLARRGNYIIIIWKDKFGLFWFCFCSFFAFARGYWTGVIILICLRTHMDGSNQATNATLSQRLLTQRTSIHIFYVFW